MIIFRNFCVLILFWSTCCFAVDATGLIEAIERRDSAAVIDFFDQIHDINIEEAKALISNVYGYYTDQFGIEILNSEDYLNNLDYCREIYHSILDQNGISLENSLIHNKGKGSYEILLCGKKNKEKKGVQAEVPGSMVLGGGRNDRWCTYLDSAFSWSKTTCRNHDCRWSSQNVQWARRC